MTKWNTILFDFDYTLADSTDGEVECINYGMISIGLPTLSSNQISAIIGLSLKDAFLKLVGQGGLNKFDEFRTNFLKRANIAMADRTSISPDTFEILDFIKKHNFSTGIVSTKYRRIIKQILVREHLYEYIDVIIGGDDVRFPKPNPQGLIKAIKILKGSKQKSIYVGDSVVDAETAKRAGVTFIAILTGPTTLLEFKPYKVKEVVNRLHEISRILC